MTDWPLAAWNRRMERMRYLRRLPLKRSIWLYAAVICTFGTIGFVNDLSHVAWLRPWASVLVSVAIAGLISCGYIVTIVRWRAFALVLALQLAVTTAADKLLPAGVDPRLHPPALAAVERQANFDAIGCLSLVVAGYALFIGFISREGLRQARLDAEIKLAREIHERLVPPLERRTARFELLGRSLPSTEVGGDLIDAFETDGDQWALIADVTGHGVTAGTLMAMVRAAIRTRASTGGTLAEVFASIDRLFLELERADKFVTLAALRFRDDGVVEALLAGHLPVLVVRAGGRGVERLENARPPLGLPLFRAEAEVACTRYESGDLFVLITDGLTEVQADGGEMLGLEEVQARVVAHAGAPLSTIADALFERARAHGAAADDQTLLLVRAL